jgi:hypothetical protein
MNSISGEDVVVPQMYVQSLTFIRATFLKTCMKVEMFGSQEMLLKEFCSRC